MNRKLSLAIATCCGCLLILVIMQDLISTMSRIGKTNSRLSITPPTDGYFGNSTVMIIAFDSNGDLANTSFYSFCNCTSGFFSNFGSSIASECHSFELWHVFSYKNFQNQQKTSFGPVWFWELPRNYIHSEYIETECESGSKMILNFVTLPLDVWKLEADFASKTANFVEFLNEYTIQRPPDILSSGYFYLVKMSEVQFADVNGDVSSESRYIYTQKSQTSSGNESQTEIVIMWDESESRKVTAVQLVGHVTWLPLVATFILATERIYATYSRFAAA